MKPAAIPLFLGVVAVCWGAQVVLAKERHQPPPSSTTLIQGYRSWTRVTPGPVLIVDPQIALCAAAAPPRSAASSPHAGKYIHVYVNRPGRQPMLRAKAPRYPVGTIIVKEKLATEKDTSPELLTVMEKKAAFFDPKHGDWQYSVFDGQGRPVATGSVAHCQTCHEKVARGDFVFRNYLPKSLRSALR